MHRALNRLLTTSLSLVLGVVVGVMFTPAHALASPAAAPVLTVPLAQTVNEASLLSFMISATDADGQPLVLRATSLPAGSTFQDLHDNTGRFTWTPSYTQAGPYSPRFTADDTFGGTDSKNVGITVNNVNQAPVLDPIGDHQVERGTSSSVFVTGSDPDGDNLTFSTNNLPSFCSFTDFGGGMASLAMDPPGNMAPGTFTMTVTLTDGTATTSETFSIDVYSVGSQFAPVLAPIGNQTVAEGAVKSVNVSATDQDGETLTWTLSLPGFATFTPNSSSPGSASGTLSLAPGYCAAGTYSASVGVSDGSTTTSETFTVTVTDVNRLPAWIAGPNGYSMSLAEGASASLTVVANDPDQACGTAAPTLSYVNTGAPLTVSLTNSGGGSGSLQVSAGFDASGTYTLTLRATDAMVPGATTDVAVHVTVSATNRAPVADAGGPYAGLVGSLIAMSADGSSDPDGDALTYDWNFGDLGSASGVSTTHAYAASGHYNVTVSVSDGSLSASAQTTADARLGFLARAFTDHNKIMLKTGKPRETFYLEPLGSSFPLTAVDLSSLQLTGPDGLGSVPYISPLDGSVVVGTDSDRNHVAEIAMDFSKDDLRSLFTNLDKDMQATFTLSANILGGGSVRATVGMLVQPERKLVARIQPNPMNPVATVRVNLEQAERLTIRFYDMNGRLVRTLLEGVDTPAGVHDILFDGHGMNGQTLATGQYYYRASTPTAKTSGSVMILK